MKRKKDLKKRLAPTVRVIARTGIFWNPMEAAILGVEMGTPLSDDWLDFIFSVILGFEDFQ